MFIYLELCEIINYIIQEATITHKKQKNKKLWNFNEKINAISLKGIFNKGEDKR